MWNGHEWSKMPEHKQTVSGNCPSLDWAILWDLYHIEIYYRFKI